MSKLDPLDLGKQLKKPTGEIGLSVADNMNSTNLKIYDFILSKMEIGDGCEILEIGGGNGKLIPKFFKENENINISAIDFSEDMCSETQNNNKKLIDQGKLLVRCEDSSKMSFEDESFDKILTINTVYFWENIASHLQEMKRVLKTGGLVYIGYRPASSMVNLPFAQEVFEHFKPGQLQSLTEESGFRTVTEESNLTTIDAVDGNQVQSVDHCLIIEKTE
ncbi:MAG: class I SAM-dependent methyltransferase [Reichenbachiella sp.]